jgi:predicted PolB exonuclease-like 3'-5' exonuclease
MLFRIVDIETVPDLEVWKPGQPKWSLRPGFGCADQSRLSSIAAAGLEATSLMVERSGMVLVPEEPFPPPQANRVIAIAWCDVAMRDTQVVKVGDTSVKSYEFVECHSICHWDKPLYERNIIREFGFLMEEKPATLVTWNGRGFDLPVLAMRAMHLGVPWGWYYDNRDYRYRYSDTGHVDLMDFLSDYGATRQMKLDDVSHLIGLPGKAASEGFDGSMVAELVKNGSAKSYETDRRKVARYCLQDVIQTTLVFLRTRYHLGILDIDGYERSLTTFSGAKDVRKAININWERVSLKVMDLECQKL